MDEYTKWVLISGFYWLVSSITAAAIAEWEHRSGGGFFLASFFFLGPLGVAVALLATPGEVRQFGPTGTSGQTATAPTGSPAVLRVRCLRSIRTKWVSGSWSLTPSTSGMAAKER